MTTMRSSRFGSSLFANARFFFLGAGALTLGCGGGSSSSHAGLHTSPADAGLEDAPARDSSLGNPSANDAAPGDATVSAPRDAALDAPGAGDATASDGAVESGATDAGLFTAANWMSTIPGSTSLAALSIPGTHDTGATVELSHGTTRCQNLSVADQLAAGVRSFDIRCRNVSNQFEIYHTTVDQNLSFDEVLQSIFTFFAANPSETLIMSVKEEEAESGSTNTFEQTFDSYTAQQPSAWYLGPTIPTLDQVRGKIVLLRRFGATSLPKGIDATVWADNTTFTIANGSATLRIQDYYQVTSDDAKWAAITSLFTEALQGDAGVLYLNNTSGYEELDSGLEDIPVVSDVINPEVTTYFSASTSGRFGIIGMDFVDATKGSLVLSTNFK
jgi:1-phosphatidylinositol phosphodiesterase